jgi:hypothetical protein
VTVGPEQQRPFHSVEDIPVEAVVLDGLEEVGCRDAVGAGEVGDGPRDLEDPVIGARLQRGAEHGTGHTI